VAVYYDPLTTDVPALAARVRDVSASVVPADACAGSAVDIPVCYGGDFGPDLEAVAQYGGVSDAEVVTLHAAGGYRAFMIGFLPGFAYLGVVPRRIAAPRRQSPRTRVAAGSVGIAGQQTGVYPRESPGGWNIIGRTPVSMFVPSRRQPSLVRPGDLVRFVPIDRAEFDRLATRESM
jgi:inhibitor of KinA